MYLADSVMAAWAQGGKQWDQQKWFQFEYRRLCRENCDPLTGFAKPGTIWAMRHMPVLSRGLVVNLPADSLK